MNQPRSTYVPVGEHEIHVTEWGDPKRPALVMWHGLARTGRDFDEAAAALSDEYFVICPDTIGRGLSSWSKNPTADYTYSALGQTAVALLDGYGIDRARWVGTSMGGLIGVTLAAGALEKRMSHLVINDIGPDIPEAGLGRIATYVGTPPVYDTVRELEAWLRRSYAPFGPNTDAFWRRMADSSARRTDDGRVTVHYDPRLVALLTHHKGDRGLWPAYEAIEARTLILRGENSDVLSADVAEEMTRRGPKPRLVTFAGIGHAPTLTTEREIRLLREFLAD